MAESDSGQPQVGDDSEPPAVAQATPAGQSVTDDVTLADTAQLLGEVVDINRVLVDPRVQPMPGSPAALEIAEACQQPGESGPWGEQPVREAYTVAVGNYHVALEHAQAITTLTSGDFTAVPASVLVRALVEVASQAWWLLEPGIGHVNRVRRLQALRYRSAVEGEKTAKAMGLAADEYHLYVETEAQVARYSEQLQLEIPRVDGSKGYTVYECGSERLPTPSYRVIAMFDGVDLPSVYRHFSGYSHGDPFVLWREFVLTAAGDTGPRYSPVINEDSFKGVVAVASYGLHPPAHRLIEAFGLTFK
jgi:hypothetical protein